MDTTSSVTSVTAATGGPASSSVQGSNTLGESDFLKLLMAQLANQDPTAPVDSTAFVTQLAQFSSLELQQSGDDSLNSILMAQAAGNQTSAVSLVGKEALFSSTTVTLGTGSNPTIVGHLATPADNVTAVITDSTGKTVRTIQAGSHAAGEVDIAWDGLDDKGNPLPAGDYSVALTASKKDGTVVPIDQETRATITGVSFSNGVAQLMIGDQQVQLSSVIEIDQPAASSSSSASSKHALKHGGATPSLAQFSLHNLHPRSRR